MSVLFSHYRRWLHVLMLVASISVFTKPATAQLDRFSVEGYGIINYYKFWWDTDLPRRAAFDLERFAIEPEYRVNDKVKLEAEIEFEHGGTGSTMEFDKLEEFGEYEQEIEKGGEVVVEKLAAVIEFVPEFNLRVGHFYVPIGLTNSDYEPGDYFTVARSEMEFNIIPATWHETGIEVFGQWSGLRYRAQLVNGLDATGFSSASWIARGHQGRFEMINAENMAVAGRVDYQVSDGGSVGASGYFGNSADNRPKPDLTVPAHVAIGELHGTFQEGPFLARAMALYGSLENAGAVSKANRNLSNNLNVKRSPVGSAALGWYAEAGYDLLPWFYTPAKATTSDATEAQEEEVDSKQEEKKDNEEADKPALHLFGRYERYDTMHEVAEGIFDNPRWERNVWTIGLNYRMHHNLTFKADFTNRTLGIPTDNIEQTLALGMGVEF